jgi:phage repressor protein C with HTH and peptisase S24 domain
MKKRKEHYLDKLFTHFKMSVKKFSESIGLKTPDRLYLVLKERNDVSSDLAGIIISKYPQVSYEWLLTGEGEMLKSEETNNTEDIQDYQQLQKELSDLKDKYIEVLEENRKLRSSPFVDAQPDVAKQGAGRKRKIR